MNIKTWTTLDGNVLKIEEMELSHIKNCIAMIVRNYPNFRPEYLEVLKLEVKRRESPLYKVLK